MCKCLDCKDRSICEGCIFSCRLCPKNITVPGLCPMFRHIRCLGAFTTLRIEGS
jgi:hypothetical protein